MIIFFNRRLHLSSPKTTFPTVWKTAYVQSHCVPRRDEAAIILQADALGKCLSSSIARAAGKFPVLAANTYSRYAFALTMEHSIEPGYCTEKAVIAAEGGAIPIYDGDATILCQILNCDRVIMWDHGKGAKHVEYLLSNRSAYKALWGLPRFNVRGAKHLLSEFRRHAIRVVSGRDLHQGS